MAKKLISIKSIAYLLILSIVLMFSLYNLFSEDAQSWFVVNKLITINPIYGRVLSTGAGKSIASFKNNDSNDFELPFGDEQGEETDGIIAVPGDIIHFVYLISISDLSGFDNSTISLQGIYGDESLRGDCMIFADSITVSEVSCTPQGSGENIVYEYNYSDIWQTISHEVVSSLSGDGDIDISTGASNVSGNLLEDGAYADLYVFLINIPVLYIDTGENQNTQKCEYTTTPEGLYVPIEGQLTGQFTMERCVVNYS